MSQKRFNVLDLISIESKFLENIDYENIINEFASNTKMLNLENSNALVVYLLLESCL